MYSVIPQEKEITLNTASLQRARGGSEEGRLTDNFLLVGDAGFPIGDLPFVRVFLQILYLSFKLPIF